MNRKYKELARNTVLFTISSFGTKILSFLLVPLYTSVLTTADYGVADIISTSVSLLIYILTLNISSAVLRFAIDGVEYRSDILTIGLRFSLAGGALLALGVSVCYVLDAFDWEPYCYLFLVLSFVLYNLNDILNNYLRAIDKVPAVVVSGLLCTGVTILCNIVFLLVLKLGGLGYLASGALGVFASVVYSLAVIKPKNLLGKLHPNARKLIRSMLAYSIPMSLNGIAWWVNASLDKYFVTAMVGIEQNGLYAVASKIPTILSTCLTIFLQAWGLSAVREYDEEDKDGFFAKTYELLNTFLVALCSALILINVPLAKVLFAKEFFAAWECSSILLVSGVFSGISGFVGSIFGAVKDSKSFAASTVCGAAVNIVLNACLIPSMGILGAGVATALSFAVVLLVRLLLAKRHIKWKVNTAKCFLGYGLLGLQVFVEHKEGHMYLLQIAIFVIIVLMYRKSFMVIISTVIERGMKLLRKKAD